MEFKIRKLRELIAATVGEDLKAEGFSIDKSLTWVTKKVNKKNKIKCFINCYDYTPTKIEFRLIFQIWVNEIVIEMERYHEYIGEPFQKEWPVFSFCEGDFNSETRHLEHKIRNAYTHIITEANEVDAAIKACRITLKEEIIPILPTFSIFENLQEYVLQNYKDIRESTLTKPSIIAMKLKGKAELNMLVQHFWRDLKFEQKPKEDIFRKYVEHITEYSESE